MTDAAVAKPMELLTSSRMRAFRECARKHDLLYVRGYRPARVGEALRFGTLVHLALEAYWNAIKAWQEDSTILESLADVAAFAAIEGSKDSDAFEKVRAMEMVRAYCGRWKLHDEMAYDVLAVEIRFDAPLLNPDTMAPSRTWRLAGKIDVILERRSDGRVLVMDHKTTQDEIEGDDAVFWTKLVMDSQASQYAVGAEALGHNVDELLWDVLKKPSQRPLLATPVESRKYTKEGALYASQRALDETVDEYGIRLRAIMAETPGRYLARKEIPRSSSQLLDFLFDAWSQANTMRESARLGRAPRNPDACHRMGVCPMWDLCSTGADPADYPALYIHVDDVHPELSR